MEINIIGIGYVGLVSGVCLAAKGHNVTCYDINKEIVDSVNNGNPHIYEPGLGKMLKDVVSNNKFIAKTIQKNDNYKGNVIIIAVGTPSHNGEIDLKYIKEVSKKIGFSLKNRTQFMSIIVKSTTVPGTTDTIVRNEIEKYSGKKHGEFGLGMNPEFLREGSAVIDFMDPDRIVLGYDDLQTLEILNKIYEPWNCDKITVNTRTAEMIKYANNSLLATQISIANELANIVTNIKGIDISDVMEGVHLDKRWSPILKDNKRISPAILTYLFPGCGFGGSCFPKDVEALRNKAYEVGVEPLILNAVLKVNENQPFEVVRLLKKSFKNLINIKIMVLGLAFKPNTDDVRESVAIKIISKIVDEGAIILAHDPIAIENFKKIMPENKNLRYVEYWEEKLESISAIILLTKWEEYNNLLHNKNHKIMSGKVIIDDRRMFNPNDFHDSNYLTIGRSEKQNYQNDGDSD